MARPCLDCGRFADDSRCNSCKRARTRARDAERGTVAERGYGTRHNRARRSALAKLVDGDLCVRCGQPMMRDQDLDLDHNDDRSGYLGLAHRSCNRRAGGAKGNERRWGTPAAPQLPPCSECGRPSCRRPLGYNTRCW